MDITGFISRNKKLLLVGGLVLLLVFLVTFPRYGGIYHIRVLTTVLTFAILAASWAMFSGTTGYMSLAPAVFFGLGVYTMCVLEKELPFPVIVVMGGLVAFAFALLVGLVTLRLKGIYFAIFTFGLVVFMQELINYLEVAIRRAHGWHITPLDNAMLFYTMLGLAVVTVLAIYFIRRSKYGLAMMSIGGNEEAAEHMGINTTRVKVLTFAISSIFMGAAGVITAPILIYVNSTIAFSLTYSFFPILMAVFGGMGQLYGPIVGAVVFTYLERLVRNHFPSYFLIGFGIILVVVILFLPTGLAGLMPTLQSKLWGPVPALRKERTWKPKAAGILSIIGGVCQVILGIIFAIVTSFLTQFTGMGLIGGLIGLLLGLSSIVAFLLIILGLIAILGGICALRRSSWGLALAGAICAVIGPGVVFGIPAIIFAVLAKGEFEYVVEGGKVEQYANT